MWGDSGVCSWVISVQCYLEASCPWHPQLKWILCHNTQTVMRTYSTCLGYNILSCLNMIACSQAKWHSSESSWGCDFWRMCPNAINIVSLLLLRSQSWTKGNSLLHSHLYLLEAKTSIACRSLFFIYFFFQKHYKFEVRLKALLFFF